MSEPSALRILHVTDSEGVYGAERMILDLCTALRGLGHSSLIASIRGIAEDPRPIDRAAMSEGVDVRSIAMRRGLNVSGAMRIAKLACAEQVDVIHSHGYKGNILLGFLPQRVRNTPLVATVHGYTHVSGFDRIALYSYLDRLALRRADRVVLVHRGMTSTVGLNRLHDPLWRVIENGIQSGPVNTPLDESVTDLLRAHTPVIGAIGRLSPEKGFDVLIKALREVLNTHPNATAVIIGEGPERRALERLARRLGIADRVTLPGYRPDAKAYLQRFDMFVLPSLTEGLPITLLEAMQAGVPVVATKVGGVPDALDEGRGGILVPPGAPETLAGAIQQLASDRDFARRLARHAQLQAAGRFTSERMAQRYVELYLELKRSGPSTAVPQSSRA